MPEINEFKKSDIHIKGNVHTNRLVFPESFDRPLSETIIAVNSIIEQLKQRTIGAFSVSRILTKDEIDNLPPGCSVALKSDKTIVEILDRKNRADINWINSLITNVKN